jgi:hypothetical protein
MAQCPLRRAVGETPDEPPTLYTRVLQRAQRLRAIVLEDGEAIRASTFFGRVAVAGHVAVVVVLLGDVDDVVTVTLCGLARSSAIVPHSRGNRGLDVFGSC